MGDGEKEKEKVITVNAMINMIFHMTRSLFALEIVLRVNRLPYHLQAMQLMVNIQSAEIHPRAIREPHRGTVNFSQVVSGDSDAGILSQLVPSIIQLRPWWSAKGIQSYELVLEEPPGGLECRSGRC